MQRASLLDFSHLLWQDLRVQRYFAYTITDQEHLAIRPSGERIIKDYGLIWPKTSLENTSASEQKTCTTAATDEDRVKENSWKG